VAQNGESKNQDRIAVDFIDPLFAVVLSISFTQIYTQRWFLDPSLILQEPFRFSFATLVLAYYTVIASWIGYHVSIKYYPISVRSWAGRWRFALDVLLLISYFVLLVSYDNFLRELWTLVIVFLLFIVWDIFKCSEYPETRSDSGSAARRGVTRLYFLLFLAIAIFYRFFPPAVTYACQGWATLAAAFVGTYLYRKHKDKLWWEPFLRRIAMP
jgi:hypothetical protein